MSTLELWILRETGGFRFLWSQTTTWGRGSTPSEDEALARFAHARCVLDAALNEEIERLSDQAAARMDRLDRQSKAAGDGPLHRLGALIHQRIFPASLSATLDALPPGSPILLTADEPGLPWELAFDGKSFLMLEHSLGRRRLSGVAPIEVPARRSESRALIIGNPSADLDAADDEALRLLEIFDAAPDTVRADLLCRGQATRVRVLEALASGAYGLVHFACHARNGALRMADGDLAAEELAAALRGQAFVYLNACASARGENVDQLERKGMDNLVESFLSAGASGVIGTRWPVYDDRSAALAETFYRGLALDKPLGEALRAARAWAHDRWPAEAVWAAPVLYGDPKSRPMRPNWSRHRGTCLVLRTSAPEAHAESEKGIDQPGSIGPEDRAKALRRAANGLQRMGARIAQIDAGGLTALFGVPNAREDDAPRAVAAAQRIVQLEDPALPGLSIGIESGTISLEDRGLGEHALPVYASEAIDQARKIASSSGPGEIRVGSLAARLCEDRFRFEGRVLLGAADLDRTKAVSEGGSPEARGLRLLGRRRRLHAAPQPFVGRDREMALLLARAEDTRAGSGGIIGISGEAGVGKSGLLLSFRERVEDLASTESEIRSGPTWIHVDPDMSGGQPFAGLAALLHALSPANRGERVSSSEDPRTHRLLRALIDGDGEEDLTMDAGDRGRLVHHLRQGVARALRSGPLFLAIENAQRLDVSSMEIFEQAFMGIERMPVLLMLVHRPNWRHDWASQPAFQQLSLEALDREAIRGLLSHRLGRPGMSQETEAVSLEALVERSGGNPFFAEELAREIRESAGTAPENSPSSVAATEREGELPGRSRPLPETIERLLLARLGRLDAGSRMALETAAVLDAPFAPALLRTLTGQDHIEATIADLESQGFLLSRWETGELLLRHALVGETARRNLGVSRRRGLNRRIAAQLTRALSRQRAAAATEDAGAGIPPLSAHANRSALIERIAVHAFRAVHDEEEGLDLGAEPDALLDAASGLLAAGTQARRRYAARQAATHFRAALTLLETLDDGAQSERIEANEGLGEAYDLLGRFDAAIEAYSWAFEALTQHTSAAGSEAGRFHIRVEPSDPPGVTAGGEAQPEDRAATPASKPRRQIQHRNRNRAADLARRIGRLLGWGAHYDEALTWMERGLSLLNDHLRADERGTAALIHIHTGTIQYYRGQLDQALEHVQRGLGVVDGTDHARARATGQNLLGAVHDAKGNHEQALVAYSRSLELWEEAGDPYEAARVRDNIGITAFHLGRWDAAERHHRHALDFFETVEDRDQRAFALLNLGNVHLVRGDFPQAEDCFAEAESLAEAVGSPRIQAMAQLNRAHRAIAAREHDQALSTLTRSEQIQKKSRIEDLTPETQIAWGRAKRMVGDEDALAHAQAALEGAETAGLQVEEGLAQRLLGQTRADQGDLVKAQQHLRWSLGILEGLAQRHESERSRLALASVLFEMGRDEEARALLATAQAAFESLAAAQDVAEATALAEKYGPRPSDQVGS